MEATVTTNGNVSFWYAASGVPEPRPALPGDLQADVAIVGAGYTGLWTAYYLKKAEPSLNVVVLESRFAGFGASGRNGGWLANTITGGRTGYERAHGRAAVGRFQELLNDAVDEVCAVAAAEGIDADIVKGGELLVARNPAQLARLHELAREEDRWPEGGATLLSAEETAGRVNVSGTQGGMHVPHCARIHPAKLVRGLAAAVERLGVPIYEDTEVTEIVQGVAVTRRGRVHGPAHPARDRGVHREPQGPAPGMAAHELVHGRHLAAACRGVGTDRLGRPGDAGRSRPRLCLPAAYRG